MRLLFAALTLSGALSLAQTAPALGSVHKVFIDKMPTDLDQYLRAEFSKQMKGRVTVVLSEKDADGYHNTVYGRRRGYRAAHGVRVGLVCRHSHLRSSTGTTTP